MYNQQEYTILANYPLPSSGCESRTVRNNRKKKTRFRKKVIVIAFSAMIFGVMAGGTFYGVNALLNHLSNQTLYDTQKGNATISPVSYSSDSVTMSRSLDVSEIEPLPKASPLWDLPNVFITPHIAGPSFGGNTDVEQAIWNLCFENIERFLAGQVLNHIVDLRQGY